MPDKPPENDRSRMTLKEILICTLVAIVILPPVLSSPLWMRPVMKYLFPKKAEAPPLIRY